jgi:hypothetical protein
MRIAVVRATGRIGRLAPAAVARDGHAPVQISRSLGVDAYADEGFDAALAGADAVKMREHQHADADRAVDLFSTTTANLLDAEERAAVRRWRLTSSALSAARSALAGL